MSIEAFVFINLLMNMVIFAVSARCLGHIRWHRVLLASALGSGYAWAAYRFNYYGWLTGVPAQAICLLLLSCIVFGRRSGGGRGVGFLAALFSAFVAGGIMAFLKQWIPSGGVWLALAGWPIMILSAFAMDVWRDRGGSIDWVHLKIATRMGSCEVYALIDTGNRLHEPLSGLPVVIVGSRSLRGILDESCLSMPSRRPQPGFRVIHYGGLGGNGCMQCFKPKSVCIEQNDRWLEAPDLWIAIYPDPLPSGIEAIAPPVFPANL